MPFVCFHKLCLQSCTLEELGTVRLLEGSEVLDTMLLK